jgi:molecular chaperone GrpE (heat shock protein)
MMSNASAPQIVRWPFLIADLFLLALAGYLVQQGSRPLDTATMGFVVLCVMAAAWLGVTPWMFENRARIKFAETDRLADTVQQITRIEEVGERIAGATGQWLTVQDRAEKTASTAKEIAEKMNLEAQQFRAFLERANENEKAHLRLEVDKLRRAEADWIEVLVRIMDNVFALHAAAVQSGQARVIEQLTAFQHVCRDQCRRIGLTPFAAAHDQPFDPAMQQAVETSESPAEGSRVIDTLAPGYSFQGQLLRRALVRIQPGENAAFLPTSQPTGEAQEENTPAEGIQESELESLGEERGDDSASGAEPEPRQKTFF